MTSSAQFQDQAEALLRDGGSRVTRGRIAVLACLLEASHALTHAEVEAHLDPVLSMDRVTVYRILDWLTQQGLAHRIAGDDRVWRFNAEVRARHVGSHPHFQCNTCGDVVCLDEVAKVPAVALPAGFKGEETELTVRGICAACAPRRGGGRKGRSAQR